MHDIRPFIHLPFTSPGSLLYIGARPDAHSWLDELLEAGNEVVILEAWLPNVEGMAGDDRLLAVIHGDARDAGQILSGRYDYTFWWHGPEHLNRPEIGPVLAELEDITDRLIVTACPWGEYPQDTTYGNPYERHLTTLYPEFFQVLGYEVRVDGEPDQAGSEIVAWKVIND